MSRTSPSARALRFAARTAAKTALARMGLEVRRATTRTLTPVADMQSFLEHLRRRGLECTSILDVGANRGDWARLARAVHRNATIFMIEPQVEMKRYLDPLCRQDGAYRWLMAGAGAEPGELTLTVWDDLAGSSFFAPPGADSDAEGKHRAVPVITIDSLLEGRDIEPPQLVKLDVQGFELEALKGAEGLFGQTEVFILEVSLFEFLPGQPVLHEVMDFMLAKDYVVYDVAGLTRRPHDGALGQIDLCFTKKHGFLRRSSDW